MCPVTKRPNILLIVSDQERQRDWIPEGLTLPNRQRLIDDGLEFTRHYTHSSPCSPSRASLFTGRFVSQHTVTDNVIMPAHRELDPSIPTLGHLLRDAGYRTAYVGKWHLSHSPTPDMESYGFSDWQGNDRHFMGWAGTGMAFDPPIAQQAADWLAAHATDPGDDRPWFLVVALVNPHDVMWFPIDQPEYRAAHADDVAFVRSLLDSVKWKESDSLPAFTDQYDEVFDELPANFDDDLFTKPAVQRQWLYESRRHPTSSKHGWSGGSPRTCCASHGQRRPNDTSTVPPRSHRWTGRSGADRCRCGEPTRSAPSSSTSIRSGKRPVGRPTASRRRGASNHRRARGVRASIAYGERIWVRHPEIVVSLVYRRHIRNISTTYEMGRQ
jgi:Sulfatase